MIFAPRLFAKSITSGPAITRVSLLATAISLPASKAAQVPKRPAAPTIAVTTTSTSSPATFLAKASGPTTSSTPWGIFDRSTDCPASISVIAIHSGRTLCACSSNWSTREWAESPVKTNLSGKWDTTSRVLRPMDPVDPKSATRRGFPEVCCSVKGAKIASLSNWEDLPVRPILTTDPFRLPGTCNPTLPCSFYLPYCQKDFLPIPWAAFPPFRTHLAPLEHLNHGQDSRRFH